MGGDWLRDEMSQPQSAGTDSWLLCFIRGRVDCDGYVYYDCAIQRGHGSTPILWRECDYDYIPGMVGPVDVIIYGMDLYVMYNVVIHYNLMYYKRLCGHV